MPPQAMPYAMSRVRGVAYARRTHCFSSYFGFWTFAWSLRSIDADKDCGVGLILVTFVAFAPSDPRVSVRAMQFAAFWLAQRLCLESEKYIDIHKDCGDRARHARNCRCFCTLSSSWIVSIRAMQFCSILAHAKAAGIKLQHREPIYSLNIQLVRITTLTLFRTCKYCG